MIPDGMSPHLFHRKHLGVNTMIYLRKANDRGHANHG
ncbi:pirin family protein, partial [Salmonella enterica subsp. enterica serovar Typhimurium]|nr:pirin family protein [Salmonella enterica subsp. enterica serovar Typhimurium]